MLRRPPLSSRWLIWAPSFSEGYPGVKILWRRQAGKTLTQCRLIGSAAPCAEGTHDPLTGCAAAEAAAVADRIYCLVSVDGWRLRIR